MGEPVPARVFVSYAPEDHAFFERFEKHLAVLRRRGLVDVWHEGRLQAGASLATETRALIDEADVVVLLVSPDFAASDRLWKEQLGRALQRHELGELTIVPIQIRPVLSEGAPFERFQTLPRDGKAIGDPDNDEAWLRVAEEVEKRLQEDRTATATGKPSERAPRSRSAYLVEGRDRPDDFSARVEKLCRLREKKNVVRCRAPAPFAGLWEVEVSADTLEVKPVAALDGPPTAEAVHALDALLDERYRGDQPYLASMLVYRGTVAPPKAVADLARRRGIALRSFDELNRLINFRDYLDRLHRKLSSDPVYPQTLYIEQRGYHVAGKAGREVPNALDEVWSLITDDRQPRFVLVLADFGTGKTFLLRQLAARLAEAKSAIVPVLVELRALEKARSLDVLLTQHFTLAGERSFDLDAFFHMLEQGKIALLFDGFDELVPRVSFDHAAEHLETLIEAARGKAKVVITSRTQHFLTDKEVEMALARRADRVPHRQMFKILPFSDDEIRAFLVRRLGSQEEADRRFALLGEVTDLLGLSHNPRMLSFIVEIDEKKLLDARDRTGKITKAELYTLLVERWIGYEFKRAEYKGVPTLLNPPERWRAVMALAERMWGTGDKGVDLRDMPSDLRLELVKLGPADQDAETKLQSAASGTLLVRDEEGRFSFLHRSLLEFSAAWAAALALRLGKLDSRLLTGTEMTDLMAEFFGDLATPERGVSWAQATLSGASSALAKKNAQRVLDRLSKSVPVVIPRVRLVRRNEVIRGESFAGRDLRDADLSGSDLSEAVFTGANLTGANLAGAKLVQVEMKNATLANADLRGSNLTFARLSGADLRGARLEGAVLRYARLIDAKLDSGAFDPGRGPVDVLGASGFQSTGAEACTLPETGACLSIAVSPDGHLLACGYSGGTLVLWATATGKPLRAWAAHSQHVWSVAFTPDGSALASASEDRSVRFWSVAGGAYLGSLQGHTDAVLGVAFSPDGLTLASGSRDRTARLWRVADGAVLCTLREHTDHVRSVAFSPDGLTLASGSSDCSVRLWRVADGASHRVLQGHTDYVRSVAFHPSGLTLASGSDDTTVRVWRLIDGALLRVLGGHSGDVSSVAFSPDGLLLASGSQDASVRLWRVGDDAPVLSPEIKGHAEHVRSVAFSPDGLTVASGSEDASVRVWRAADGASLLSLESHGSPVRSVAVTPDGATVVSGSDDGSLRLWRVAGVTSVESLEGHGSSVRAVAVSPDGVTVASGSSDGSVRLWHSADGISVNLLAGHSGHVSSVAFTQVLEGHSGHVSSVAFSPDGATLASGSHDRTVRLWRVADSAFLLSLRGHSASITSVAFSPDGSTLVSGSEDTTCRLWRVGDSAAFLTTLQTTYRGHSSAVRSVAFDPDGRIFASGSDDGTLILWSVTDGVPLRVLNGHSGPVQSVAFSPDGDTLASCSDDQTVMLWRTSGGSSPVIQPPVVLRGHTGMVRSVAFSPTSRMLASASEDGSIRLWRVADGVLLATLYATDRGWVAFTPEGRYKLSGDLQGSFWHVLGLCRFEPGEPDEHVPDRRMREDEPLFQL